VAGGNINLELLFEGLGLFLKGAMGGYGFEADTPVADANTHTFTLAKALPFFTLEASKADVPTGEVFQYPGSMVNTLGISVKEEEILEMVAGIISQTENPGETASGTPSFPSFLPALSHMRGTLTLAGAAALLFKTADFAIDNKLERRFLGQKTTREPKRNGKRVVSGSVVTEFDDLTLYTKYKDGTPGALSLLFTSDQMVTGATPYSLAITAPDVWLNGKTPAVPGEGIAEATWGFISLHDGTSTDALTIAIVNGAATLA